MGSSGIQLFNHQQWGYIWVNFITTEPCSPEPWNHVNKRNYPKMAQHFRLVNDYNLPRPVPNFWDGNKRPTLVTKHGKNQYV